MQKYGGFERCDLRVRDNTNWSERGARDDHWARSLKPRSARGRNKDSEPVILCAPAQLLLSVKQPAVDKGKILHGGIHDARKEKTAEKLSGDTGGCTKRESHHREGAIASPTAESVCEVVDPRFSPDKFMNSLPRHSFQKQKPASLDKISRLDSIEIHAGGQTSPVKLHLVIPGFLFAIDELCDQLAEGVVDYKSNG